MDPFFPSGHQYGPNGEPSSSGPSTYRDSLFQDEYNTLRHASSTDFTDLSRSDSAHQSEKHVEQSGQPFKLPFRDNGFNGIAGANDPLTQDLSLPQDSSQFDDGQSITPLLSDGSISTARPYRPAVLQDFDLEPRPDEVQEGMQIPQHDMHPSTPWQSRVYGKMPAGHPHFASAQSLSTPFPLPDNSPPESGSGKGKKRRLSNGETQIINYNDTPIKGPQTNLYSYPFKQGLQPEGVQILSIWAQKHPGRPPNAGELLALSVVTEATESAILYWFSDRCTRPIHALPTNEPRLPATPTPPRRPAPHNTCTVKRRVPKPWNKARDPDKPYSCLSRCGWTFTKKGDWIKHEKINHPEESFSCPIPNCNSYFGRKDKLRDHIRKVHKISPDPFDLDSRRIPVGTQITDRCGFCGQNCSSWQEWYDHVGAHFEDRIEGGPWTMARWRYPWVDEASEGNGGDDDGSDPGNGGDDRGNEDDAPFESDDSLEGYGGQGGGFGPGRGFQGPSRSGGGRDSGSQNQGGRRYHTRSSQPPAPSNGMKAAKSASRTNSMPHLNQHLAKGKQNKVKREDQCKILHPTTWPLNKDQSSAKASPSSPMRTERTNPLVDLAVSGKSQRDAHNAELAPYIEKKAQVLATSSQGEVNPGGSANQGLGPLLGNSSCHRASIPEACGSGVDTAYSLGDPTVLREAKRRRRRACHNLVECRRRDNINERIQDLSRLLPQPSNPEDNRFELGGDTAFQARGDSKKGREQSEQSSRAGQFDELKPPSKELSHVSPMRCESLSAFNTGLSANVVSLFGFNSESSVSPQLQAFIASPIPLPNLSRFLPAPQSLLKPSQPSLPKASYVRPKPQKSIYPYYEDHKDGFRGEHELRRHIDRAHKNTRKVWVCVDNSTDSRLLADSKACRKKKRYCAYYNAAAAANDTCNQRSKGDPPSTQATSRSDSDLPARSCWPGPVSRSEEKQRLFSIYAENRDLALDQYFDTPRSRVCRDQPLGNSSVLEVTNQIPFQPSACDHGPNCDVVHDHFPEVAIGSARALDPDPVDDYSAKPTNNLRGHGIRGRLQESMASLGRITSRKTPQEFETSTSSTDRTKVIIGVDFGTTFSGVTYTIQPHDTDMSILRNSPVKLAGDTAPSKVPSTISYESSGNSRWGFDASHSDKDEKFQRMELLLPKFNPPQPFVCSFAQFDCASTPGSKNEWKCHVSSQHLQLGYYHGNVDPCNPENARTNDGAPTHIRDYTIDYIDYISRDLIYQSQDRKDHRNFKANSQHNDFACQHLGWDSGFTRYPDVLRHEVLYQSNSTFPCTLCKRHRGSNASKRKDHLEQHLRNYHLAGGGATAIPPRLVSARFIQNRVEEEYSSGTGWVAWLAAESDVSCRDQYTALPDDLVTGGVLSPSSIYGDVVVTIGEYMYRQLWGIPPDACLKDISADPCLVDISADIYNVKSKIPSAGPILNCEYNQKGFTRRYDKTRHVLTHFKGTMVSVFCYEVGSAAENSFKRPDVLKWHLTPVSGVDQSPPITRKQGPTADSQRQLTSYSPDTTDKFAIFITFSNAQDFYNFWTDCQGGREWLLRRLAAEKRQKDAQFMRTRIGTDDSADAPSATNTGVSGQLVKYSRRREETALDYLAGGSDLAWRFGFLIAFNIRL